MSFFATEGQSLTITLIYTTAILAYKEYSLKVKVESRKYKVESIKLNLPLSSFALVTIIVIY